MQSLTKAVIIGFIFAFSLVYSGYSNAGSPVRQLEKLHGKKEGTRAMNRRMRVNTKKTPWCGAAIRYSLEQSGKKRKVVKNPLRASSWFAYGRKVDKSRMRRDDLVLFRSRYAGSGYHVAWVSRVGKKTVKVCSGNTRNRVLCGWRSKKKIAAVRR